MKLAGLAGVALVLVTHRAQAATWAQGTTPRLGQIFAVDRTEEPNWIFGSKDVLNDGPAFGVPEQQRNLRTAYAAADQNRLWTRIYVSNATAVDPAVTVFVFIDADQNPNTGGGTVSNVLSPMFTAEHSPGGYEFVVGLAATGTVSAVWAWQQPTYVPVTTNPGDTVGEIGRDTDPIGIAFNGANTHGYVQGNVLLSLVGLTPACNANLYVRSAASSGLADLDMDYYTSCVPAKTNGIPAILVATCTSDAQCPQNGVCVNGQCALAPTCATAADCPPNDMCTADGRCVPNNGGACTSNANCTGGLVCVGNQCIACTPGQNQCSGGTTCAPNGTCVVGTGGTLPTGSHVEGGAFNCAVSRAPNEKGTLAFGLGVMFLAWSVRRRSR